MKDIAGILVAVAAIVTIADFWQRRQVGKEVGGAATMNASAPRSQWWKAGTPDNVASVPVRSTAGEWEKFGVLPRYPFTV